MTVSANVDPKTAMALRSAALKDGKSLRVWAGEVLTRALSNGTKPKKTRKTK